VEGLAYAAQLKEHLRFTGAPLRPQGQSALYASLDDRRCLQASQRSQLCY
jgi:hypothetical protein